MLLRLLRRFLGASKGLLVIVVLVQAGQTVAALTLPRLMADIIDEGVVRGDEAHIWRVGAVMVAVTIVQVLLALTAVWFGSKIGMGFGRDVRGALFHRVTDFSAREIGRFGAPSLITRITNDVTQVQMLVQMTATLLIAAPITAAGGIVFAVREDVGLSVVLAVCVPLLVTCAGIVIARMVPTFRVMQERIDGINGVLREQITGIRVVRAFVREPHERRRFDAGNVGVTATGLTAGRLMAFMFPMVTLILNCSTVAVIWIGADRIAAGDTTVGALVAFLSYLALILSSVMMATFIAAMAPRASVCADRIIEVLDTASSVVPPETPSAETIGSGSLELRDVGFHYPGAEEPVLEGVSFVSAAGQTTAIIGSTGSGKTTLLNLIPRLADVTSGAILVDGVDVRDLRPEALWSRVGVVPQRPYLFSGTVASNLRFGKPDATDAELWEALEIAQARDFVSEMGGLDAVIVQGGANVSGGQRQRLAIARALVRKPEVYLFDDSFSALDLATDARLRAALVPFTRGATIVVVAQRVSTIKTADQILVLEDGRTVGLGTHEELLRTCPTYQEIVASQLSAEEAA